jgi:hypothetical protein
MSCSTDKVACEEMGWGGRKYLMIAHMRSCWELVTYNSALLAINHYQYDADEYMNNFSIEWGNNQFVQYPISLPI